MSKSRSELNKERESVRAAFEKLVNDCETIKPNYLEIKSGRSGIAYLISAVGLLGSNLPNESRLSEIDVISNKVAAIKAQLSTEYGLQAESAPTWTNCKTDALKQHIAAYQQATLDLLATLVDKAAVVSSSYSATSPGNSGLYTVLKEVIEKNGFTEGHINDRVKELKAGTPATEESKEEDVEPTSPTTPAV